MPFSAAQLGARLISLPWPEASPSSKSTFARILRTLVARWPDRPKVELITTDGFLHPNAVLQERGLMTRKGFPESYDMRRMIRFLADIKGGEAEVAAPIYSHMAYDIIPGESQVVKQPDVLIFEGLNVLQSGAFPVLASDFFDFSVYLDAAEADIESWFLERFPAPPKNGLPRRGARSSTAIRI